MSDDPKPGWYVIIDPDGRHTCRWRENSIVYATGRKAIALDDLLRDAARYRWLRDNCSYVYPMVAWGEPSPAECGIEWSWQQVKPDEAPDIDALIDADIARENGE